MTYDYMCDACRHTWELDQKITAPPVTECPACGKDFAKRLISGGVGFQLKGAGWASDGYGS